MDAWERWRIVCLAALSVEDIEDIYLFGTMITGLLLIGLGFALGYRRIQKTGTAVQSLTRLPVMTEAVGRAVSIENETINRNKNWWYSGSEWTKRVAAELECGYSPKQITILSFWLPRTSTARQGRCWKCIPGKEHCIETLFPPPHSTDIDYKLLYFFFYKLLRYFSLSSLSSCKCCIFFNSLSSCSVYPLVICMCMYRQVDG